MIPRIETSWQSAPWQRQMAEAVRDPAELLSLLELGADLLPAARAAARQFGLRVPLAFVRRMAKGDPDDPLLRQVLPLGAEMEPVAGFATDPVGDLDSRGGPGLLHKYHGRALLITTGACAVHCRYCFRRHFPYAAEQAGRGRWQAALDFLAAHREINEVILSGGDPLSLGDDRLAELAAALESIPHVDTLRLHSRTPVVLPARVDTALLTWLRRSRLRTVMVIHANHAQELDDQVAGAMAAMQRIGITLLNQAVLLRGVNDCADTLAALSRRLFAMGVLPYYLHQLDRVAGAAHFEVPETDARALMTALRAALPGYLVPRLVRERAGAPYKQPLS